MGLEFENQYGNTIALVYGDGACGTRISKQGVGRQSRPDAQSLKRQSADGEPVRLVLREDLKGGGGATWNETGKTGT